MDWKKIGKAAATVSAIAGIIAGVAKLMGG